MDSDIEALNRELKHMKKHKLQVSKTRNLDVKSIIGKTVTLKRDREKLKDEFSKSRAEVESSFKELNEAKSKAFKSFNLQSQGIDMRINENLGFFRKKLNELVGVLKLTSLKPEYTYEVIEAENNKPEQQRKLSLGEPSSIATEGYQVNSTESSSKRLVDSF